MAAPAADTVTEYAMPTATGTPASASRCARPASLPACIADWQAFSTATGTRCSASSDATAAAGTGAAFPSSAVSKNRNGRRPSNGCHRAAREQQPPGRRASSSAANSVNAPCRSKWMT